MNSKIYFNSWINSRGHKTIVGSNISNCQTLIKKYVKSNPGSVLDDFSCVNIEKMVNEISVPYLLNQYKEFELLNADQAASLFFNFLNEKNYPESIIPKDTISLETAKNILSSINQIRLGKIRKDAGFDGKITNLISDYLNFLGENKYDYPKLLDLAISIIDAETCDYGKIGVLENTKLTHRELEFLNILSNNSFTYLAFLKRYDRKRITAKKVYGFTNEVRFVINNILERKHNFGEVSVYYSDPLYENILDALFITNNIPHNFISAKHIASSNYASLILSYLDFYIDDYKYENLLKVVNNPLFSCTNEIIDSNENTTKVSAVEAYSNLLNNVSIGFKKENYKIFLENKDEISNVVEHLSNEQNEKFYTFLNELISINDEDVYEGFKNIISIINRYCIYSNDREKISGSVNSLLNLLKYRKYPSFIDGLLDIKNYFLSLTIKEEERTNAVNCISLSSFDIIDRKYIYIIGLQASSILLKETETPLISNNDLISNLENVGVVLSKQANDDFANTFNEIIDSAEEDAEFVFTYSCYSPLDNRQLAPSNFILEVRGDIGLSRTPVDLFYKSIDIKDGEEVVFDDNSFKKTIDLLPTSLISKDQIQEENELELKEEYKPENARSYVEDSPISSMSASSFQTLINCPYQYYYSYILRIPQIEQKEINGMKWLGANEKGTIFHAICEEYFNKKRFLVDKFDENSFESVTNEVFNKYVKIFFGYNQKTIQYEFNIIKKGAEKYIKSCVNDKLNKRILGNEIRIGRSTYEIKNSLNFQNEVAYFGEIPETNEKYTIHFHGNVDRADYYIDDSTKEANIFVTDYKTSANARKENQLEKSYKQHIIYPVGIARFYENTRNSAGFWINEFDYVYPLSKEGIIRVPMSGIDFKSIKLTDEMVEILNITEGYRLTNKSSRIEKALDKYFADENHKIDCSFCKMRNVCKLNLRGEKEEKQWK